MIEDYAHARLAETDRIRADRRVELDDLAGPIAAQWRAGGCALVFLCTHNSRRSQMAQIWAQFAALRAGLERVTTFSAGTAVTAFEPRAVAALRRAGVQIEEPTPGANPVYRVRTHPAVGVLECRSKLLGDPALPATGFIAVATCSTADAACPVVPGASLRARITYEDPKSADDTPTEAAAYDACCAQIAREMLYLFDRVVDGVARASRSVRDR